MCGNMVLQVLPPGHLGRLVHATFPQCDGEAMHGLLQSILDHCSDGSIPRSFILATWSLSVDLRSMKLMPSSLLALSLEKKGPGWPTECLVRCSQCREAEAQQCMGAECGVCDSD